MSNPKQTSRRVAADAARQLSSKTASKVTKELAASDLAQARGKAPSVLQPKKMPSILQPSKRK